MNFISDYKKRRAEKVMSDQKDKVKQLRKLCKFKIVNSSDRELLPKSQESIKDLVSKSGIVLKDLVFTDTFTQFNRESREKKTPRTKQSFDKTERFFNVSVRRRSREGHENLKRLVKHFNERQSLERPNTGRVGRSNPPSTNRTPREPSDQLTIEDGTRPPNRKMAISQPYQIKTAASVRSRPPFDLLKQS